LVRTSEVQKKGHIALISIIAVQEVPEQVHKKANCFAVVTGKKTYFIFAETSEECRSWIAALIKK